MSDSERRPATVTIIVEGFTGDGREVDDHLRARLYVDDEPMHEVTFTLSHLDYMRTTTPEGPDEAADVWDRAIEEMAGRLAAELTYAGLLRFDNPINVQSHVSSLSTPHRTGLRQPGTMLATFGI